MIFKDREFDHIGDFGHCRVLQDPGTDNGVVVDLSINAVCEQYSGNHWPEVVRAEGVPLFSLHVNGTSRAMFADQHGAANAALHILMSERALAPVIIDDTGRTVATVARTTDGALVCWANGKTDRWRNLTWVVLNGNPVALVGMLHRRNQQV